MQKLGAIPIDDERVEFRVWAPNARSLAVRVGGRRRAARRATTTGPGPGTSPREHGDDYRFVVDGDAWPDPCSRFQPEGVRGPSRVVDTSALRDRARPASSSSRSSSSTSCTSARSPREGTFDGVIPHLRGLRELGITAIEVMPVATFPGNRNWGYDGLYNFAPHPAYGGPEGLARLVDAAHREGLGVILDVVYNHIGPGSEAIAAFGPYFTDRHDTFWGAAIDYSQRGVREWAIQNAELWTRDYRIDGLRLDAVHAIYDDSKPHVLAELKQRVDGFVISEMNVEDLRPLEEWGHDAMWLDSLHHDLHVLLTGETTGYFADFGSIDGLVRELTPRAARAVRRLRAEPRPGRQPRVRRPPAARRAPRRARLRALRARDAARLHGRGVRGAATRSSSSPTTSTRRSPRRRARGAAPRSSARPGPAATRPIRRRSRRSSARSSSTASPIRSSASCSRCGRRCRATLDVRVDGKRVTLTRGDGDARRSTSTRRPAELRHVSRAGLAGHAVPARRDVRPGRDELRALLRAREARRALPVRRRRQGGARRARRADGAQLARLPARRRSRPALRVSRPRRLGAEGGPSLQRREAPARPVRQGDRRRDRLRRPRARCRTCRTATTPTSTLDTADDAARDAEVRRRRRELRLGGRRRTRARARRGTRPSSTRCTSRASRSRTPTCARTCAARTRGSRRTRRSRT